MLKSGLPEFSSLEKWFTRGAHLKQHSGNIGGKMIEPC
jgi:hypothetical protein